MWTSRPRSRAACLEKATVNETQRISHSIFVGIEPFKYIIWCLKDNFPASAILTILICCNSTAARSTHVPSQTKDGLLATGSGSRDPNPLRSCRFVFPSSGNEKRLITNRKTVTVGPIKKNRSSILLSYFVRYKSTLYTPVLKSTVQPVLLHTSSQWLCLRLLCLHAARLSICLCVWCPSSSLWWKHHSCILWGKFLKFRKC